MIQSNVVETIPANKHVFVCGTTGTGKSYLTEQYVSGYKYVVKLDTKGETDERIEKGESAWTNLCEDIDFTICRNFSELDDIETDKIIYVPDFDEQNEENFDMFFRWIFERGNTILWIDELMSVASANRCPRQLHRIYTQGRSKGVGVWACSQRPSGIPTIALANSQYFFVFDLTNPADRKKLVDTTGQIEMKELPTGYNFWYFKMGDRKTVKAVLTD